MTYESKTILLKDGRKAEVTETNPKKSAEMLDFLRDILSETEYLTRTAAEVTETPEQEQRYLQNCLDSPVLLMLVCCVDGTIAGNCHIRFYEKSKMRHRAAVGISIRKAYWNLGIGTCLFQELIAVARQKGIRQIELEVIEGNTRALALYHKMGFVETGKRPDAFRMADNTYRDEIFMTKML